MIDPGIEKPCQNQPSMLKLGVLDLPTGAGESHPNPGNSHPAGVLVLLPIMARYDDDFIA